MGAVRNKLLALDANVLIDLAAGEEFALDFIAVGGERGYSMVTPPTVVRELLHLSEHGGARRKLYGTALGRMLDWQITPFNIDPVGNGICHLFSEKIRQAGILDEHEENDGLILAETAYRGIPVLITSDRHLLNITDQHLPALHIALTESGLDTVSPMSPRSFLRILG
ncbi:MAG: type II toxin-antitoxin system VapC family toxin [Verrucomicrobiales bacterium]|jgi:predicted nucleic acid-binding protein|nr:type II toxin-antitoxin system VapC family toxin [Verrucomicrobiales bacterium]